MSSFILTNPFLPLLTGPRTVLCAFTVLLRDYTCCHTVMQHCGVAGYCCSDHDLVRYHNLTVPGYSCVVPTITCYTSYNRVVLGPTLLY